jgi:hypothetical protein
MLRYTYIAHLVSAKVITQRQKPHSQVTFVAHKNHTAKALAAIVFSALDRRLIQDFCGSSFCLLKL